MAIRITLNGEGTDLDLQAAPTVQALLSERGLKADRVAVERNGEILPRTRWSETLLEAGDRLEIVHFVGGGTRARL